MTENLFQVLDVFFGDLNFKIKKRIWYREQNDGFVVCQFQRFRFDKEGSGFLNFGILYTTNEKRKRVPKGEETWDLRGRYKDITEHPKLNEIFPIELINDSDKKMVQDALINIKEIVIPYLTRYSELQNLVNDLRNKNFDYGRAVTRIKI